MARQLVDLRYPLRAHIDVRWKLLKLCLVVTDFQQGTDVRRTVSLCIHARPSHLGEADELFYG